MNTFIIYARKSTESEDRQVMSIGSQIKELRQFASQRSLNIERVYEESCSAKDLGRPVFTKLMDQIQAGQVQGILCWKLDRLARNPVDGAALIWALTKRQLKEIAMPGRSFTGTSDDKLLMQIEFGMATKYVDDLSENVKRGKKAKLEQGWLPGVPPIGYLNDRSNRTIIPDPDRFPIVRQMWELIIAGSHSVPEAVKIANEQWGLRTRQTKRRGGKPLSLAATYALFANRFYAGVIVQSKEAYPGAHKPMVTQSEFEVVRKRLGVFGGAKRSHHYNWPFTGLIRCGMCDRMVTAEQKKKPSGKRYFYYHCCHGHPGEDRCIQPSITGKDLENQILSFIDSLTLTQSSVRWALKYLAERRESQKELQASASRMLRKNLQRSERELHNLTELRLREQIDDQEYLHQKQRVLGEITSLKSKTASSKAEETVGIEPATRLISFLKLAKKAVLDGSGRQRSQIFSAMVSNPRLKDRKLVVSAKKPFSMIADFTNRRIWWDKQGFVLTYLAEHPTEAILPPGPWLSQPLDSLLRDGPQM